MHASQEQFGGNNLNQHSFITLLGLSFPTVMLDLFCLRGVRGRQEAIVVFRVSSDCFPVDRNPWVPFLLTIMWSSSWLSWSCTFLPSNYIFVISGNAPPPSKSATTLEITWNPSHSIHAFSPGQRCYFLRYFVIIRAQPEDLTRLSLREQEQHGYYVVQRMENR